MKLSLTAPVAELKSAAPDVIAVPLVVTTSETLNEAPPLDNDVPVIESVSAFEKATLPLAVDVPDIK